MEEDRPGHGSHTRCNGFGGRAVVGGRGAFGGRGAAVGRGASSWRGSVGGRGAFGGRGAAVGSAAVGSVGGRGASSWRGSVGGRGASSWRGSVGGRGAFGGMDASGGRGSAGGRGPSGGRRHNRNEWGSSSARRSDGGLRNAFDTFQKLSEKNPSEVAITLSSMAALQAQLNEKDMSQDLVQLLCSVLCKAFQAGRVSGTVRHLVGVVKDSEFLRVTLPRHVARMASESGRRTQYTHHLDHILAVVFEVLKTFPDSSMLVTVLRNSIRDLKVSGMEVLPQTDEKLLEIQDLVSRLKRPGEKPGERPGERWRPRNTSGENHDGEEQGDFRDMPLYPTPQEIHGEQRPFLRPNVTSQPYASNRLYLDTHFRLLREDFVRPLREGIQELLRTQMANGGGPPRRMSSDDITVYRNTSLVEPKCTRGGVAYVVQFDPQPFKGVRWENGKKLIYGSLVCLSCDNFETLLYATVSESEPKDLRKGRLQIIFTEDSRDMLGTTQTDRFVMVETTAFFEAYRYVLEGLKEQDEARLPFQRNIVDCNPQVLPPAYLKTTDTYNLSAIVLPEHRGSVSGRFSLLKPEAWPPMEALGLDESQMKALKMALTQELAIIQGPPGTGKTHVGLKIAKALLTNGDLWSSGAPLLVVCFTNHALDQFLEGILKFLPKGIVRVGGRSSSEALTEFNLRELTRDVPSYLRSAKKEIFEELDMVKKEIRPLVAGLGCSLKGILQDSYLKTFMSGEHWTSLHPSTVPNQDGFEGGGKKVNPSAIMEWLGIDSTVFQQRATEEAIVNGVEDEETIEMMEEAHWVQSERALEDVRTTRSERAEATERRMMAALEAQMLALKVDDTERRAEPSDQGWEMQRQQRRNMRDRIRKELDRASDMTQAEEEDVLDVWLLSPPDRWRLYRLWVARYRMDLRSKAVRPTEAYQRVVDRLDDVQRNERIYVLTKAKVVGMTTTGAAKFRNLLQEVQPRLVIVEEAAQVLEAHTITALSAACQHLILIGDHQQLRPSATVYDLGRNYDLEVSMFERLINMELPYVRLNSQHRMKPNIACLLTPHIYPDLQNHPSVMEPEDITGLTTNLFFLEHTYPEDTVGDGKSHQNEHEAMFVVALCHYLLQQDYKPQQITILTTYTAQLLCLGKLMQNSFAGVTVKTVDKYQGEENDIILLSLVRSNAEGKVGFLSIPNRVCVALSRAKKALYCICNGQMLGRVKLWAGIFGTLREKGEIGAALTLRCRNHPDRQVDVSCAEDFEQAPEGGCTLPCDFSLECGHPCALPCHPRDPEHKEYQCPEKCARVLCDLNHKCPLVCHLPCPKKCTAMVEKTIPECQHKQMVPCHQDPKKLACQGPCQKMLPCGHNQLVPCHQDPETFACQEPCQEMLQCGHACTGSCHSCHQGRYHSSCARRCQRLLICSHKCQGLCDSDCAACRRPCENRCVHSKCKHPCGHPCTPCTKPCAWQCPHQRCSKLCHEPCDRLPCVHPCDKILDCGHACIGVCGEKCPNGCRVCDATIIGTEEGTSRTDTYVQLEDCGHLIETTGIDWHMGRGDKEAIDWHMERGDKEGKPVAIRLKDCPDPECQTPIRNTLRYGTQIKTILTAMEKVKAKRSSGCQTEIAEKKKTLRNQWMMSPQHGDYMSITVELSASRLMMKDVSVLENKLAFLEKVETLKRIQKEQMSGDQALRFQGRLKRFVTWLLDPRQRFTDQQVWDLQHELKELILVADRNIRFNLLVKQGPSPRPFTGQDRVKQAQDEVKQAQDKAKQAQDELKQAQDKVKQAEDELKRAQGIVKQAQDKVKQAQDEVKQVQDTVKQAQDELKQAQDKVKRRQDRVKRAQYTVKQAQDIVKQAQGEEKQAQDTVKRRQDRMKRRQDTVKQAQEEVKQAQDRVKRRQDKVKQAQDTAKQAQDKAKQAQDIMKQAQDKVKQALKIPDDTIQRMKVKRALKSLDEMLQHSEVVVSDRWYRCLKGHVYVMSKCDGAAESERCPDCDTEQT